MPDPLENLEGLYQARPQPEDGQWLAFERDFGLSFPKQYKNVIDRFGGTSSWFNESMHVLSPIRGGHYSLWQQVDRILSADRESREHSPEHFPLPLFPEERGLFPWAVSDYAIMYWITRSGVEFGPDQWPTLIRGLRSFEFEVHFEPVGRILYLLSTGKLRSIVVPAK